ncbi:MAG: ATP-binding cassette domain-containing protein [Chloroflexota bacterium]
MTQSSWQRQPIIQLEAVDKVYTTGAGDFQALKNINLTVYPGEFLGIVGKSGAGKSTLLNVISGVSELSGGQISFYPPEASTKQTAVSIGTLSQDELARWRGKHVGIVYQSFELMPMLDLVDNVMLPPDFAGSFQAGPSRQQALELLEMVEIGEHAHKIPAHVSGGQKQRVAIARALANDPAIIIADEPTGSLDSKTSETIFGIFEKLVARGKTVIMVTHDRNLAGRFSRALEISDGEIIGEIQNASVQTAVKSIQNGTNGTPKTAVATHHNGTTNLQSLIHQSTRPAITLTDVTKTYVGPAGTFTALKNINLTFHDGDFVSIVGKSGSGKSTLLNMLTGIDHPTSGEVVIGGTAVYDMTESERALWRGRTLGIVFQFFQLLPTLTLLENTMLPMDYCNVYPRRERKQKAMALLDQVGLANFARKLPSSVSSGQQQSAAIARALANDPPIIVADEPTGNLDTRSANIIVDLFRGLARQGKTILIVTHDPSLTRFTDRTVTLVDGRVAAREEEPELSVTATPQPLLEIGD